MNLIKTRLTVIALASLLILPFGSLLAANPQGQIKIDVTNENNQEFAGAWYLYQGINDKGLVKRNGSKGEQFNADTGNYYLEVQPKNPDYQFYLIQSENPQTLKENGTNTYKVQYFKTEDQFMKASAELKEAQKTEAEKAEEVKKAEEAKKLAEEAAKNTNPANTATAEETKKAEEAKKAEEVKKAEEKAKADQLLAEEAAKKAEADKAEAEEKAKQAKLDEIKAAAELKASLANVPNFQTMPAQPSKNTTASSTKEPVAVASVTKTAPQLAATGSPALLTLLVPSLMGAFAIRRRK